MYLSAGKTQSSDYHILLLYHILPHSSTLWYQYNDNLDLAIPTSKRNMLTLTSYVTKPKSGKKKYVVVMTTIQPFDGITTDDHKTKPSIMKVNDFTKGGTDIVDQRMNTKKFST